MKPGALVTFALLVLVFLAWVSARLLPGDAEPMLPITFAHADHQEVNCVDCHHEFVDATPRGPCFECHKADPTVAHLVEVQFHDLCRGCHVERLAAGLDAGPARACIACHSPDDAP